MSGYTDKKTSIFGTLSILALILGAGSYRLATAATTCEVKCAKEATDCAVRCGSSPPANLERCTTDCAAGTMHCHDVCTEEALRDAEKPREKEEKPGASPPATAKPDPSPRRPPETNGNNYHAAGLYEGCLEGILNSGHRGYSFKNNCTETVDVAFYGVNRKANIGLGGIVTVKPGKERFTSWEAADVRKAEGIKFAICRKGFLAVDAKDQQWKNSESLYRCKKLP